MELKKKQDAFDVVKWFDSIKMGADACGSYAFCKRCDKRQDYPCARAQERYTPTYIRIATVRRRSI